MTAFGNCVLDSTTSAAAKRLYTLQSRRINRLGRSLVTRSPAILAQAEVERGLDVFEAAHPTCRSCGCDRD